MGFAYMTTNKNNAGNDKNKLMMVIFFTVFAFLIFGGTGQSSADTCKRWRSSVLSGSTGLAGGKDMKLSYE
jgi:hypothetical protein